MSKKYFFIFLACLQLQDCVTILGEIYLDEIKLNEDVPAQAFIPENLSPSPSRHMSLFTWWKARDNCLAVPIMYEAIAEWKPCAPDSVLF